MIVGESVVPITSFRHLSPTDKPHNPLINAGALVVCSLLKQDMNPADRFDFVSIAGVCSYFGTSMLSWTHTSIILSVSPGQRVGGFC